MSAVLRATTAASLLAPDALALLRVLSARDKVSMAELRRLDPSPQTRGRGTISRVNDLRLERMVKTSKPFGHESAISVEILPVGRQALAISPADAAMRSAAVLELPVSHKGAGAHPGARDHLRDCDYHGEDLTRLPPRGAGSLHAFTLPSVVNGVRIERRRPSLLGSAVKDPKERRPL